MFTLRLVIAISVCIAIVAARKHIQYVNDKVQGYYWRDYAGEIPGDAIPGGRDAERRVIYIGQTIHRTAGVIVPGKISVTEKNMYFEFNKLEHSETVDVKILCSQNPNSFQWIKTKSNVAASDVTTNTQSLVVGGHDKPFPVVIGRAQTNNELQVGKVLIIDEEFEAIHLSKNGLGWQEFEVLVYEENSGADEETCDKKIEIHIH